MIYRGNTIVIEFCGACERLAKGNGLAAPDGSLAGPDGGGLGREGGGLHCPVEHHLNLRSLRCCTNGDVIFFLKRIKLDSGLVMTVTMSSLSAKLVTQYLVKL